MQWVKGATASHPPLLDKIGQKKVQQSSSHGGVASKQPSKHGKEKSQEEPPVTLACSRSFCWGLNLLEKNPCPAKILTGSGNVCAGQESWRLICSHFSPPRWTGGAEESSGGMVVGNRYDCLTWVKVSTIKPGVNRGGFRAHFTAWGTPAL
jgi:hypothetical protein